MPSSTNVTGSGSAPCATPDARRKAFERAHLGIRALVHARRAGRRDERRDDRVAPALGAGRGELQHDACPRSDRRRRRAGRRIRRGQATSGVVRVEHRGARRDRARDAPREERGVDASRADRRSRRARESATPANTRRARGTRRRRTRTVTVSPGFRMQRRRVGDGAAKRSRDDVAAAIFRARGFEPQHRICAISQARHRPGGRPRT